MTFERGRIFRPFFMRGIIYCCMKKVLATSAVTIGCVVGAGFVSGREALVFFGGADPLFCAAAFFLLFFVFVFAVLRAGAKHGAKDIRELDKALFGKFSPLFDGVFLLNGFFALSAMLAGGRALGGVFCELAIAAACAAAILFGIEGIKIVNVLLVPLIAGLVLFLSSGDLWFEGWGAVRLQTVFACARYAAYNAALSCGVLNACGKELTEKGAAASAALSSLAIAVMIFCILNCLRGGDFANAEMPLLSLATGGVRVVFVAASACAVATSAMSAAYPVVQWAQTKTGDKTVAVACVFICAYVVGLLGFSRILNFVLPVASLFSAIFLAGLVLSKRKPA